MDPISLKLLANYQHWMYVDSMKAFQKSRHIPKKRTLPLFERMSARLVEISGNVVLREDFHGFASYGGIGKCLKKLVVSGSIVRIGQGIYAKATIGPISGKIIPKTDIKALAKEAMQRLGVEIAQTEWERAYAERQTDQMPLGNVVAVKSRVRRKIEWGTRRVEFERTGRR